MWAYFDFLCFPLSPAPRKMQTSCWNVVVVAGGLCEHVCLGCVSVYFGGCV